MDGEVDRYIELILDRKKRKAVLTLSQDLYLAGIIPVAFAFCW